MKKTPIFGLLLLCVFSFLFTNTAFAKENVKKNYYKAEILNLEVVKNSDTSPLAKESRKFKLKILDGYLKGQVLDLEEPILNDNAFYKEYSAGEKVIVLEQKLEGQKSFVVYDHYRMNWIYYLAGFFVVVLFLIGRSAGFKALISMLISVITVAVMIPLVVWGFSPVLLAAILGIINTIVTIRIVAGRSKKTLSSILGTISGIVVSFIVAYIVGANTNITGLTSEEAALLVFLPGDVSISARSLLYAGVLLGSLGAVMDVAMSISSAIEEISLNSPDMTYRQLFKSGMNVGRDIMGTMTNTLVLAYLASSLPLMILLYSYSSSLPVFYNMDKIVSEIVRALSGSIGIIVSIPITCAIGSLLYKNKEEV